MMKGSAQECFVCAIAVLGLAACAAEQGAAGPAPAVAHRMPTKGTPADFTAGGTATVGVATSCAGSPETFVIPVEMRGGHPLRLGEGCVACPETGRYAPLTPSDARSHDRDAIVARKCAAPAEPVESSCGLFFDAFGGAVAKRAGAEGIPTTGIGINACGREKPGYYVSTDDWRAANRLVAIVEEEAKRSDASGAIAVVVTGIPIATLE